MATGQAEFDLILPAVPVVHDAVIITIQRDVVTVCGHDGKHGQRLLYTKMG
jgi:hypothetical protein